VPVQLAQVVRGAGEQPFAFACGQAAAGHHGQFLAGLELPEDRFHGAGPQLVVLPAAVMSQAPRGAGGGRELAGVPGSSGRGAATPPSNNPRRRPPLASASPRVPIRSGRPLDD
jgi:hypothetical protein